MGARARVVVAVVFKVILAESLEDVLGVASLKLAAGRGKSFVSLLFAKSIVMKPRTSAGTLKLATSVQEIRAVLGWLGGFGGRCLCFET